MIGTDWSRLQLDIVREPATVWGVWLNLPLWALDRPPNGHIWIARGETGKKEQSAGLRLLCGTDGQTAGQKLYWCANRESLEGGPQSSAFGCLILNHYVDQHRWPCNRQFHTEQRNGMRCRVFNTTWTQWGQLIEGRQNCVKDKWEKKDWHPLNDPWFHLTAMQISYTCNQNPPVMWKIASVPTRAHSTEFLQLKRVKFHPKALALCMIVNLPAQNST